MGVLMLCSPQGSQFVGMVRKSSSLVKLATDVLGYNILDVCKNGPKEKLKSTFYCQPAVLLSTLLAAQKVQHTNLHSVVGYSLGEISALVVADWMSAVDAFRLVNVRAKAMQEASDRVATGMVSVQGLNSSQTQQLCEDLNQSTPKGVYLAGKLYANNTTVGGDFDSLNRILERKHPLLMDERVQLTPLNVGGAFHTPYMKHGEDAVNNCLDKISVRRNDTKLYSNFTGRQYDAKDDIKKLLVQQISAPCRVADIMSRIYSDYVEGCFENTYELSRLKTMKSIVGHSDMEWMAKVKNIPSS